jgi:hypothetical protein
MSDVTLDTITIDLALMQRLMTDHGRVTMDLSPVAVTAVGAAASVD